MTVTLRPGTTPYYLTAEERDMLVDMVHRKAAKANCAIPRKGAPHLVEATAGRLVNAAGLRELLFALGATPTWRIASRLKGALDEVAAEKLKKKIRRDGDSGDAATAFLKVGGWIDPEIRGGFIAVFLVPVEGARVRVLLTGQHKSDEVLGQIVELHQLIGLFESIPFHVTRKFLISDRGFTSYHGWNAAMEAS